MTSSRRVPNDLYGPILWCGLLAGFSVMLASSTSSTATRGVALALALLYAALAIALLRLRPWGRVAAGIVFGLLLLNQVRLGFQSGYSSRRILFALLNGWWAFTMFRPSTRAIFAGAGRVVLDPAGLLTRLLTTLLVVAVGGASLLSKLPFGWAVAVTIGVYLLYAFLLEVRVERGLRRLFARRPTDLDEASWSAFRRAQALRAANDIDGALKALEPLPPAPCVRSLQGLLILARVDDDSPLRRFVFDADYLPGEQARARMAEEARDPAVDVDACLSERAEVVDSLLADVFSPRPQFAQEADAALQRIAGRVFTGNAEYAQREAWAAARPLQTGARGRAWLCVRLWERLAHGAAEGVAGGSPDALLREAAGLSRRFAESATDGVLTPDWLEKNAHAMVVVPMFADGFRLLYLDLPYMEQFGQEGVASRLRLRLELLAGLRRLRDDYPQEAAEWTGLLTALLAGQSTSIMTRRKRFDPWWEARRESQASFDAAFTSGLEAAAKEDWEAAVVAFGEAAQAWPERPCARHNRGVCLLRAERHAEAEDVFKALTIEEPDEPLYWLRLGDARRSLGRSREALAAYRRAAKLGGLEQAAAVRLGLALADEGRDEEALKELDAAAGPEPDAETLEGLADFLEEEGVFGLAHHYRQKALGERLSRGEPDADDEESLAGA